MSPYDITTINFIKKEGITSTSDGVLHDQVSRKLWKQAIISCDKAIQKREKELKTLRELEKRLHGEIARKYPLLVVS